jgi:Protein of unknown function (DUF1572)
MNLGSEFLKSSIKRLTYYKDLGDKTFAQLTDIDFHYQPNEESNSIAIIIQHVAGNLLSRWTNFLTSDGEKDWRNRDTEFEEQQLNKDQLIALWEKGWACCLGAIKELTADDLGKTIYIRTEGLTVIDAINRQLAHYPYHVGQIIYVAKILKNTGWQNLSVPKCKSDSYNKQIKTGAKKQP